MADEEDVEYKTSIDESKEISRVEGVIGEIRQSINRNNVAAALLLVAQQLTPNVKDNADIKDKAAKVAVEALVAVEKGGIEATIGQVTEEQRVALMRFVCKGMHNNDKKVCDQLLAWHAKLVEKDGYGVILRVMTDRSY